MEMSERAKTIIYLGLKNPVSLRFKGLNLVMTFHTEAKSRGLAWSK